MLLMRSSCLLQVHPGLDAVLDQLNKTLGKMNEMIAERGEIKKETLDEALSCARNLQSINMRPDLGPFDRQRDCNSKIDDVGNSLFLSRCSFSDLEHTGDVEPPDVLGDSAAANTEEETTFDVSENLRGDIHTGTARLRKVGTILAVLLMLITVAGASPQWYRAHGGILLALCL